MILNELRPLPLRRLTRAIICQQVEVRVIDLNGSVVAQRLFAPTQFVSAHGWMAARSQERLHVYFRPIGHLSWALVDDLTPDMLQLMRDDGVRPNAVIETSPFKPDNLQAWVAIGRDLPREVHHAACRILATRYGSDLGSAKPGQFGRVPGTMNAKPQYWRDGQHPPLVKLMLADQRGANFATSIRSEARTRAEEGLDRGENETAPYRATPWVEIPPEFREPLEVHDGGHHVVTLGAVDGDPAALWHGWNVRPVRKGTEKVDRSATDTRRAVSMLLGGVPEALVREACRVGSDKALQVDAKHGEIAAKRYVDSVIQSALRKVAGKGTASPTTRGTLAIVPAQFIGEEPRTNGVDRLDYSGGCGGK